MAQYDYTIDPFNADRLALEIQESSITIALDYISALGSAVSVFFKAALSEAEETTLDGIAAAHTGEALSRGPIEVALDTPMDSDLSPLMRHKITKTGWGLVCHTVEFKTSQADSLYDKDKDGNNFGFGALEFYDAQDNLLTNQNDIDTSCIKTLLIWEPNIDIEMIGGELRHIETPNSAVRLWFYHEYSGHEFCSGGFNLEFLPALGTKKLDGRTPKLLPYYGGMGTGVVVMEATHAAGFKHRLQLTMEYFSA